MSKKNNPTPKKEVGLFKTVLLAYFVLVLHILLMLGLGLLVIFFRGVSQYMLWIFLGGALIIILSGIYFYRRMKAEGKTLRQMLSSPLFAGRPVEVSLLGGLASVRVGLPKGNERLDTGLAEPRHQLEDPNTIRVRELTQLSRMLEDDLITREEYDEAKNSLFNQLEKKP